MSKPALEPTDEAVIRMCQVFHRNIPEKDWPYDKSDFSDEQWDRAKAAATALLKVMIPNPTGLDLHSRWAPGDGEPYFILRAKDAFASGTVEGYANTVRRAAEHPGVSEEAKPKMRRVADSSEAVAKAMLHWPAFKKMPDLPDVPCVGLVK